MIIAVNQNLMRSKYAIVKWENAYALRMLGKKIQVKDFPNYAKIGKERSQ